MYFNDHSGMVTLTKNRNQLASGGINKIQYSNAIEYPLTMKCKFSAYVPLENCMQSKGREREIMSL